MIATSQLRDEHEHILKMMDVIEELADRIEHGRPVIAMDMARLSEFITGYIDGYHHAKEQEVLFPALMESSSGLVYGVIGRLVVEHGQGRMAARHMLSTATRLTAHDRPGSAKLAEQMRGYASTIRRHIALEEAEAFGVADSELPSDTQSYLSEAYEAFANQRLGPDGYEHFMSLLNHLETAYLYEQPRVYSR